jgi:hypothetical protein
MNRLEETKKLIKEGKSKVQDSFIRAMMDIKVKNPDLSHNEIIGLLKDEFDRFVNFQSKLELPKSNDKPKRKMFGQFTREPGIPTRIIKRPEDKKYLK